MTKTEHVKRGEVTAAWGERFLTGETALTFTEFVHSVSSTGSSKKLRGYSWQSHTLQKVSQLMFTCVLHLFSIFSPFVLHFS